MFLHEVFPAKCIKIDLEAEDKEEVFEEMVDHFCQATRSKAREDILDALREREAKMSTGIHKGIAVPHGKTNVVDDVFGVLGISRKGIDYDALDGEPVYILFMLVVPSKDSEKHLRLLKQLAELLENPQFYMDLLSQKDSQGAYNVICKYEDMFITKE
ncbi:MAG: PTS sugar transporter subunit IIA [Treponema sp.]|jgi:PTS system fructose-specific IIC component/PTS system nitrogen regulatory IIA component|nr:PTS sugar transporter subunit IIA [Treponema sp.]